MADLNKSRYTHRDYDSIKEDLINAIPSLTQEWTSTEESDPGIVLIKLISMFGDTLSYNVDKIALELYLRTVSQRKNCSMILRLLGYKMGWYRSGKIIARVSLKKDSDSQGNPVNVPLRPYTTTFSSGGIYYTVVPSSAGSGDIDIKSVKDTVRVTLVQGEAHTIKFDYSNLVNNRYYLPDDNVDQDNLSLVYGDSRVCNLVDNLYLATDDLNVSFEFDVDEYDRPYIELVNYWEDILGTNARSDKFTLIYFTSLGASGNVAQNALQTVLGLPEGKAEYLKISHSSNSNEFVSDETLVLADEENVVGRDPQTVDDARKDAAKFVFTHDTLVTSRDFEKAAKRVNGVTGSKLVDQEVIVNDGIDADELLSRALDRFPTSETGLATEVVVNAVDGVFTPAHKPVKTAYNITKNKTISLNEEGDFTGVENKDVISYTYGDSETKTELSLKSYAVILYLAFGNFEVNSNFYHASLSEGQKYYVNNYSMYDTKEGKLLEIPDEIKELGSFPYKPASFVTNAVDNVYENTKILNVDVNYGTVKLFPFRVSGTLYLNEPMSPDETYLVVTSVNQGLLNFYYPSNHNFGERPKFLDVISAVQNSNNNVKYFDADDVKGLISWSRVCDLSKFDTTSFAIYNGLDESFTLDSKFMKFRLKNISSQEVKLEELSKDRGTDIVIPGKSIKVIEVSSIKELKDLCDDMTSSLVYVRT